MLKTEWGAESNGKLPHLFIPNKTATLVSEFAVEDLSLGTTAALVPQFAVKDLPLEKNYNLGSCVCSERPASGKEHSDDGDKFN